jgi:hypothetical protein
MTAVWLRAVQLLRHRGTRLTASFRIQPIALCLLVLLATLPLLWISIATLPMGYLKYFHVAAALLFAACVISARWWRALDQIISRYTVIVLAIATYLIALVAADRYHGLSIAPEVRQLIYAAISLIVAAATLACLRDDRYDWRRPFGLALPIVLTSSLLALGLSAAAQDVDVVGTISRAFSEADPSVIEFELFLRVFGDQGLADAQVGTNLRHEVFAAILLSAFLTTYAWVGVPARSTPRLLGRLFLVVVTLVLLLLSLSRAIFLTVLITGLIGVPTALMRFRLSTRALIFLGFGFALLIAAALAGLYQLVWERIAASASYEARTTALYDALSLGVDAPLVGAGEYANSHNFVLEAFARGGLIAAAAALTAFGAILISVGAQSIRRIRGFEYSIPVPVIGLAVLVLVRMVTSGGGQIFLAEWVALGIYGAVVLNERQAASSEGFSTQPPLKADEARGAPSPLSRVADILRLPGRAKSP